MDAPNSSDRLHQSPQIQQTNIDPAQAETPRAHGNTLRSALRYIANLLLFNSCNGRNVTAQVVTPADAGNPQPSRSSPEALRQLLRAQPETIDHPSLGQDPTFLERFSVRAEKRNQETVAKGCEIAEKIFDDLTGKLKNPAKPDPLEGGAENTKGLQTFLSERLKHNSTWKAHLLDPKTQSIHPMTTNPGVPAWQHRPLYSPDRLASSDAAQKYTDSVVSKVISRAQSRGTLVQLISLEQFSGKGG